MIALHTEQANRLLVQGAISFDNVAKLRAKGQTLLRQSVHAELEVDLQQVTQVDNAALSLLVALLRDAKKHNKKIMFSHVPEVLQNMAQLYGVDELLFK